MNLDRFHGGLALACLVLSSAVGSLIGLRRTHTATAFALTALLFGMACADQAPRGIAGTYALRTIGEQPLPQDVDGFRFQSGRITLHEDSTFVDVLRYEWGGLVVTADTLSGVYLPRGDTLLMRSSELTYLVVVQPDGALVSVWRGTVFRYRR